MLLNAEVKSSPISHPIICSTSAGRGAPVHWYTLSGETSSKAMCVDCRMLRQRRMSPQPSATQASRPPGARRHPSACATTSMRDVACEAARGRR